MERNLNPLMARLRFQLASIVNAMPRYSMSLLKRVATESGVYVFFQSDGKPFRIGSSIQPVTRLKSQRSSIVEAIARSIAEDQAVQTIKKCSGCHRETDERTDEYRKILKSVGRVKFGFIPASQVEKFSMSIRQLEGLLLWAVEPKGNKWELESGRLGTQGRKTLGMGF